MESEDKSPLGKMSEGKAKVRGTSLKVVHVNQGFSDESPHYKCWERKQRNYGCVDFHERNILLFSSSQHINCV